MDKQAGGLDIRFGDVIKVWMAFNGAGAGVAPNGRLFGGIAMVRDTGNEGTTKTWAISCVAYSHIAKKIGRYAGSAYSITLTAGTFQSQVDTIVTACQKNNNTNWPPVIIDTFEHVDNLVGSMPAQIMPPGKTLEWYLNALCTTARTVNSALWPAWYIDQDNTWGPFETPGPPMLWFYDAAFTPLPQSHFTDTPGTPVGAHIIYGKFRRTTDGTSVTSMRQSWWSTDRLVATYQDTTSQVLYPNRFANHDQPGNTGFWLDEAVEDNDSTSWAQANARIAGIVQPVALPRDSVEFDTDFMVLPGTTTAITWALEGFVDEPMRVAAISWDFSEKDIIWTRITAGQIILELGEDGAAILSVPHEGDTQPEPPGTLAIALNTVDTDPHLHQTHIRVTANESPSPTALFYRLYNATTNAIILDNLIPATGVVTANFYWPTNTAFAVRMVAVGGGGLESASTNTVSGTAAVPTIPVPTSVALDMTLNSGHGWGWRVGGAYTGITWAWSYTYGAPDNYEFEFWRDGSAQHTIWTLPGSYTGVFVENLVTPDTWHFRVRAVFAGFYSNWVQVNQAIPAELVGPPTAVTVSKNRYDPQTGQAYLEVTWVAPTLAAWQNPIVEYEVSYSEGGGPLHVLSTTALTAKFLLRAGIAITLWVVAISNTGAVSADSPVGHLSLTTASSVYNLAFNGDFELTDPIQTQIGSYPPPYGWTMTPGGTGDGGIDNAQVRRGLKSLKLIKTSGLGNSITAKSRRFPVVANGALNVWVSVYNGQATAQQISMGAGYYNLAGAMVSSAAWNESIPAGVWTDYFYQLPITGTAPIEADFFISDGGLIGSNQTFWIDAITIELAFNGKGAVDNSIPSAKLATLSPDPSGTYRQTTINSKGQVTGGTNPANQVEAIYRGWSSTTYSANPEPTSDTDITGMSVSFTLAASREVIIRGYARLEKSSGSTRVHVTDGSNNILLPVNSANFGAYFSVPASLSGTFENWLVFQGKITLAAGSWTIKVRHQASQTTAGVSFYDRLLTVEVISP
jgi:hypothetical protein